MTSAIGRSDPADWTLPEAIADWFLSRYGQPTAVQSAAWPAIAAGGHVLVTGPTGSGKSLAAWLPLIAGLQAGPGIRLLYISPLRALSRDMAAGVADCLAGLASLDGDSALLKIGLRTGDTPPRERARQRRSPPDILLTTPESLFVLLGSRGGRQMLRSVQSVIVDEVHALLGSKRGAHLALSLERLQHLTGNHLQRIGLSATARPKKLVAGFLAGAGRHCEVVSDNRGKTPELSIELPETPLGPFAYAAHWQFAARRLAELSQRAGTMLVFCNTRARVERLAAMLEELVPAQSLAVHHGSVGRQRREEVEQGLKQGRLKMVICSSSLELGIDVGILDRVCQVGSPRSINEALQRAGRARHRPGAVPRLHAFPLNMGDLLDWHALAAAWGRGSLDVSRPCLAPVDVLCQQIAAMVGSGSDNIGDIYRLALRAYPWRKLTRSRLDEIVQMMHEGFVPGRETGRGPIVRLGDERLSSGADSARMCLLNAGTIPEWFEYEVFEAGKDRRLGTLDEEFAFESSPGQILQLGGQHWRILRVLPGRVEVEDGGDETPNLPFWFGDGSGRSRGLSRQVARLYHSAAVGRLPSEPQLAAYLQQDRETLGRLPDQRNIVLERFYDPSGDQHLIIHSLFGARLNRAWGLALRKRFCRSFNFELQAAATDNGILISLGAVHSFELREVSGWLKASQLADLLVQAMLDTPIFQTRLRWCANTALAIRRRDLQGPIAPQIQRNQAENLIARVFPDQLACLENLAGERQIPKHALVEQALEDCLTEYLDLAGLVRLHRQIEQGLIRVHAVDTPAPSGLAMALIHAPRNSFLDPAAAEERRTRSFETQPNRRPQSRPAKASAAGNGPLRLSHDHFEQCLLEAGYLLPAEAERQGLGAAFLKLVRNRSAISLHDDCQRCVWVHSERLAEALAIWPAARLEPMLPAGLRPAPWPDLDEALCRLVLGRIRLLGSLAVDAMAGQTGLAFTDLEAALRKLQAEGLIARHVDEQLVLWKERKPAAVAAG